MQPYLFPYLAYIQLVCACDCFVIFDDVQYIKRGWVNRNRILLDGREFAFTADVLGASQGKDFNQVLFAPQERLLRTLRQAYARAPMFATVQPLVERVLRHPDRRVARLVGFSLDEMLKYAGRRSHIVYASSLEVPRELHGADRILEICRRLGAQQYLNPPGGTGLYDAEVFRQHGVELAFLEPGTRAYAQFGSPFIDNLSVIDVMMFNPPDEFATLIAGGGIRVP